MNSMDDIDNNYPFDPQLILDLARVKMPFGKYAGRLLVDLPEPYVVWFHEQGFPKGKLGQQLALLYEIKVNGLEGLIEPLTQRAPRSRL